MNYDEIFLQQLHEYTHKNAIIADIGCGVNKYIDVVDKKFGVGIDIELPNELQNKNFVIGNVNEIPLRNGCCNIVIARMLLEHLKNPKHVLKEISRILAQGGSFIFVTPHRFYPISLAALLVPSNRLRGLLTGNRAYTIYYRLNTISEISKFLSSLGFIKVKLYKSYDLISFRFKGLNILLWIFNKIYRSSLSKLLPPHHIIGVFIKGCKSPCE